MLFFASLSVVLLAAFLCMLIKGWIRELNCNLQGIPDSEMHAVVKELREQGLARWRLPDMILILPSLIYISLALFSIGLGFYLFHVYPPLAYLSIVIFGFGVLLYFLSIIISVIDGFSPFRSVHSRLLGVLYCRLYDRLSPYLRPALVSCSALPQTTFDKIREGISTFMGKHKPLSEQAILDAKSSSSKQIISKTSISVFNRIWSSASRGDTSAHAKDISLSILLQLDVPHIRPSHRQHFPLHYELSNPSIEGAEGLAYSVCMMRPTSINRDFVDAICAGINMLESSSDPWHHLVASLTSLWVEGAERKLSGKPLSAYVQLGRLSIVGHKEEVLNAISNIKIFSAEQWCFVLSSIYVLFELARGHLDSKEIRALTEVLVGLLDKGLHHKPFSPNKHTDFWLYVMMLVLNKGQPVQHAPRVSEPTLAKALTLAEAPTLAEALLVEQDISVYGNGMTRNTENFRQLLLLSEKHGLDPSMMRRCLISILYILVSFRPMDQRQIRLVDQYMEIIKDEMNLVGWNVHLSALLTKQYLWPWHISRTVLCLLEGSFPRAAHVYHTSEASVAIIQKYDGELSKMNEQLSPQILKVMRRVIFRLPKETEYGLRLQDPWLTLYACNITKLPFNSDIPSMWSSHSSSYSYCAIIASGRLDLYDGGAVALEPENVNKNELKLITFFLSCPSPSIACRALRWYLHLKKATLASDDMQHLTAMLPIIFCKGLSTDVKHETWLLLVDVLLPILDSIIAQSPQEKGSFMEAFFGYGSLRWNDQADRDQSMMSSRAGEDIPGAVDMPTATATRQADGLGWMEDVWLTVLQPHVIHIDRPGINWPELVTRLTERTALKPEAARNEPPEGTISNDRPVMGPKTLTEYLEDSVCRNVLECLAKLLEWRTGLVPAELLGRVGHSPLLSDRRLQDNPGSLDRIKAILDSSSVINTASIQPSHSNASILNPST